MTAQKVKVEQIVDPERIVSDVTVNNSDLQAEFCRQPGLIYYYSSMAAKAERQTSNLKLRLEAVEAQVATNIRREAAEAGTKTTEATIKESVRLHPSVVTIEHALIQAKEVEQTIEAAVQGLRHKKDSLMMLGWMERDERNAEIQVREGLTAGGSPVTAGKRAAVAQALASRQS